MRLCRVRRSFVNPAQPDRAGLTLKDRWIYSIYNLWIRFRSTPFNLSQIRKRPGRVLICLPSNPEEARKAGEILPDLIATMGAESVFVVGEPSSIACCDLADDRVSLVPLDQTARSWFGLPSARIVDRLSEARFDVAVDLNPSAELLPAVLCLSINAPVRLCLGDSQRGCAFNIQVLLAGGRSARSRDTGPGIPPDSEQSDTPLAGLAASPGDSAYTRLLRVIQAAARPLSRPRIST